MKKSPPIRPGLVLKKNYLLPNNMSVSDLADKMNVRYNIVNNIISGRGSITPDIALILPKIFNDTKAEFWINLQSAYDLWYVLSEMSEQQLIDIDPRLVILAPFTLKSGTSKKELALKCHQWKTSALEVYQDSLKRNVLNVLSLFILNRFRDLTVKEVRAMLNFDLSDTKAGEELMDIGRQEGRKEGQQEIIYSLLCNRFGEMLPVQKETIFSTDMSIINRLTQSLFDFKTVEDFGLWWNLNSDASHKR